MVFLPTAGSPSLTEINGKRMCEYGTSMVKTIKYDVMREVNQVEIRRYPKIVIAKVDDPQADAFTLLYRFISGENKEKEKVKMTTPVLSQETVLASPELSEVGAMAFVMPEEYSLETLPEPLNKKISTAEIPARQVATLCFEGDWSVVKCEKETQQLLKELAEAGIKTKGKVFTMRYNAPFISSFPKRNEVAIEVEL